MEKASKFRGFFVFYRNNMADSYKLFLELITT